MISQVRICRDCEEEYKLYPKKPGLISQCTACGTKAEEGMEKLGGNMIFSHKTAPVIEIKSMESAQQMARLSRRNGNHSNLGRARSTEVKK